MFSLKGRMAPNGVVETVVQEADSQIRCIRLALGRRIQIELAFVLPAIVWIAECAAELLNLMQVHGKDGRASYHRTFGKFDHQALADVGEMVYVMPLGSTVPGDRERRLDTGRTQDGALRAPRYGRRYSRVQTGSKL